MTPQPSMLWLALCAALPRPQTHCCRCNGGVNTALNFDKEGKVRFAALQSDAGKQLLRRSGRSPDDISSIVLVEENESFIKSDAILKIAQYLQLPFPLLGSLGLPVPQFVRDGIYDQVHSPQSLQNEASSLGVTIVPPC